MRLIAVVHGQNSVQGRRIAYTRPIYQLHQEISEQALSICVNCTETSS